MKTKKLFADGGLTLIQIILRFDTDDKARKHLEAVLWKDGIVCPHCQCKDQAKFSDIKANPAVKTRAGLRWCSDCKKPFTVTVGTVFEDSKIPLRKWLIAWYLICSSKKGISSLQLQRILELGSYRTALFMAHRIRHALKSESFTEKLAGMIEADECFVPTGTQSEDKRARNGTTQTLPELADKPLGFAIDPEAALRRCATIRLPTSRKKSVKTRLKSR
jgi:transposase-like protein